MEGQEARVLFHIESHDWLKAVVDSLANQRESLIGLSSLNEKAAEAVGSVSSLGLIRSENPSFYVEGLAIILLSIVVVAQFSFYVAHVNQGADRSEVFLAVDAKLNVQGLSFNLFGLLELAISGQYYTQIIHCHECAEGVRSKGSFSNLESFT